MKKYNLPIIFVILAMFTYPLAWIRMFDFSNSIDRWFVFEGVEISILSCFCVGFSLLSMDRLNGFYQKYKKVSFFILAWIALNILHFGIIDGSIWNFFGGIGLVTIPLFIALYHQEFRKIFPYLMIFLLISSIFFIIRDGFFGKFIYGLCGNLNWSATLLAISIPIIFYRTKNITNLKFIAIFEDIFVVAMVWWIFTIPKGTILSIIISTIAIAIILSWKFLNYKRLSYIICAILILTTVGIMVFNQQLSEMLAQDIRVYLWENGLKVFLQNPIIGCGYNFYSSTASPLMAVEYYLTRHAAELQTHPHNEIIYLFATFGVIALGYVWIILLCLIKGIKKTFKERHFLNIYSLFIVIVLIIHGMVDLAITSWPSNIIFFISIVLISCDDFEFEYKNQNGLKVIKLLGFLVILSAIVGVFCNIKSSYLYRQSLITNNVNKKLQLLEESKNYRPMIKVYYDCAILYHQKGEIVNALKNLLAIKINFNTENYLHNNLLMANVYNELNRPDLAIEYHKLEYENFPLSVTNLYLYAQTLKSAGKNAESAQIFKAMTDIMREKKMIMSDIPIILNNPILDLKFHNLHKR